MLLVLAWYLLKFLYMIYVWKDFKNGGWRRREEGILQIQLLNPFNEA